MNGYKMKQQQIFEIRIHIYYIYMLFMYIDERKEKYPCTVSDGFRNIQCLHFNIVLYKWKTTVSTKVFTG